MRYRYLDIDGKKYLDLSSIDQEEHQFIERMPMWHTTLIENIFYQKVPKKQTNTENYPAYEMVLYERFENALDKTRTKNGQIQ